MDSETPQYWDMAKVGFDAANKTGLLKGIFTRLPFQRPKNCPTEDVDFERRALFALKENAVEYYASLELTGAEALRVLGPDFLLEDMNRVNSTWQRHWTEGAGKLGIDDEERRTWWARLLAGEVQQPGTFSLRTMAVMDTLSTKEAHLFTRVCDYVWNPSNPVLVLPNDGSALWKPDFAEATLLESTGLFKFDAVGGFTWGTIENKSETEITQQVPAIVLMTFNNEAFVVTGPSGKQLRLRCGKLFFTDVGRELFRLTTPNHPQLYRNDILAEWRSSYTVHQLQFAPAQNS